MLVRLLTMDWAVDWVFVVWLLVGLIKKVQGVIEKNLVGLGDFLLCSWFC